jgi:uncharacterized protein YutD
MILNELEQEIQPYLEEYLYFGCSYEQAYELAFKQVTLNFEENTQEIL